MAAYCTIEDVRVHLPGGKSIDSQTQEGPGNDEVEAECDQVTNQVNVSMKKGGIGLPIADADVLGLLKLKCAREVAYQVMAIRASGRNEKIEPRYWGWHLEFTEPENRTGLLEQIEDTGIAGLSDGTDLPWTPTMDANPEDPTDSKNPVFTRDYEP